MYAKEDITMAISATRKGEDDSIYRGKRRHVTSRHLTVTIGLPDTIEVLLSLSLSSSLSTLFVVLAGGGAVDPGLI